MMRRLTLGTLTPLLLTLGFTPTAQAEMKPSAQEQAQADSQQDVRSTEAFNLVSAAYRGEFEAQGIPSYYQLEQAYLAGEVTAQGLVNTAIAACELSPTAAEDEGYLNAVRLHLDSLTQERGH